MKPDETYYTDLISRYLFGEATPGEIRELETWVKSDPSHEEIFSGYRKTWKALADDRLEHTADHDRDWIRLKSRINRETTQIPAESIGWTSRFFSLTFRIAAAILLILLPAWLLVRYLEGPSETTLTARSETLEQTLPDGSVVMLDAGSSITYPSRFTGSLRNVRLEGRAWFDVTRDRSHPFVIAAGNTRIRVLGTTFLVNARPGVDQQEVVLASGRVTVYYGNDEARGVCLLPGDRADISTGLPEIRVSRNTDQNFLAWKTKHIVFSGTSLEEVVSVLSGVYHVPVTLSGGEIKNCRITATFEGQPIEPVLNVLAATLDLRIRKTGTGYELSGMGCNPGGR